MTLKPKRARRAFVTTVVLLVGGTGLLLGPGGVAGGTIDDGPLATNPKELLGYLDSTMAQIQQSSRDGFFDVYVPLAPQNDIGAACDRLLVEANRKGYTRRGAALPSSCTGFASQVPLSRDRYFDVFVQDPQRGLQAQLMGASIETDTHTSHRSRAFLDIWIDVTNPERSFSQLVLTNNWSDQPEVVKASQGSIKFNGENRFFVDVGRAIRTPDNVLRFYWYHYWWYDSHHHPWWWYGGYWWWWWHYKWYGGTWWWWWNWYWPWWHWWHWNSWSTWWADLNP